MERGYRLWKLVATHRDYLISDDGLLMRLTPNRVRCATRARSGHILKPRLTPRTGYLGTCLRKKHVLIHRLVALAFIDNPDNRREVNHLDGNKTNNVVSNLEWVTPGENSRHARRTGLMRALKGSAASNARLTENDIFTIRKLKTHGVTARELAAIYGVHRDHICQIVRRRRWAHI